ncbi:MAG TPA: CBS domain-containing protein [Dehalococcoidia bacterium]|nr:CBS domain-containing protein [Dehalococcoidia bacterium]
MKLRETLNLKDFKYRTAVSVGPNETIAAAIEKLVEHDRGSLPVCNNKGELVGIITERDIVRKFLTRKDASTPKTKVAEVMSTQVVIGSPDDDASYAITVMKEKRIRHLPVVDSRKLVGMISMRDLLGIQLEECRTEVQYLSNYISGV